MYLCLLLLTGLLGAGEPSVAELIRQLGSESFTQREAATQALNRLGAASLPALIEAEQHPILEVRRRAVALARSIEERLLLQPKRVRFRFQGTPLPQALREIEQQTGLKVALPENDLSGRTVTLDTGELSLWLAWEAFLRHAQLGEARRSLGYHLQLAVTADPHTVAVAQGPFRLRMRVIKGAFEQFEAAPRDAHRSLMVEVRAEPGLPVMALEQVRFTALRGDQGQALPLPETAANVQAEMTTLPPLDLHKPQPWMQTSYFPLPLLPNMRTLEIRGELRARLQVARPLLTVAAVVRAAGKTYSGPGGLRLQVLEAQAPDDGDLHVRLRLRGLESLPPPAPGQEIVRVRPGVVALRGPTDVALDMLELWDAQGRKLPRTQATAETVAGQDAAEFQLSFQPRPGSEEELRLVLAKVRTVTLAVPFVVKDVPVP
jgi:hypothetical protein